MATIIRKIRYEGYGPGRIAVMVDCLTDNRNRTVAEVRHAFAKFGGNLGADGSVSYLFNQVGQLLYPAAATRRRSWRLPSRPAPKTLSSTTISSIEVLTDPADFEDVRDAMLAAGLAPESAELTMRAATIAELDADTAESMIKMLEMLEDLDDVQQVYSNADISDDILAEI